MCPSLLNFNGLFELMFVAGDKRRGGATLSFGKVAFVAEKETAQSMNVFYDGRRDVTIQLVCPSFDYCEGSFVRSCVEDFRAPFLPCKV